MGRKAPIFFSGELVKTKRYREWPKEAIWGTANGLSVEEITTGLNEHKSPLKQISEKRGFIYGQVIEWKEHLRIVRKIRGQEI